MLRLGVYTLLLGILQIVGYYFRCFEGLQRTNFIVLVTSYGVAIILLCLLYATIVKPYFRRKRECTSGTSTRTPSPIWSTFDNIAGTSTRIATPIERTSYNPVPSYWKTDGLSELINWIDITDTEDATTIKCLVYRLWQEREVGIGIDATLTGNTFIKIKKIQRMEDGILFKKYDDHRRRTNRKEDHIGEFPMPTRLSSPIKTTSVIQQFGTNNVLEQDVYHNLHEHYLFHGTHADNIESICEDGLKLQNASVGLFGKGTYFAEDPTKSDQYAGDGDTNRTLLLMRVCLGELFILEDHTNASQLNSPPCRRCYGHECQKHKYRFDSVVADIPGNRFRFREFMVYRDHRSYPEYIITYDRVARQYMY